MLHAAEEVHHREGRGPLPRDGRGGGVGVDHQEGNAAHHRHQEGGMTPLRGGDDRGHENFDK